MRHKRGCFLKRDLLQNGLHTSGQVCWVAMQADRVGIGRQSSFPLSCGCRNCAGARLCGAGGGRPSCCSLALSYPLPCQGVREAFAFLVWPSPAGWEGAAVMALWLLPGALPPALHPGLWVLMQSREHPVITWKVA